MNEINNAIPAHLMARPEPQRTEAMGKQDFMTLLLAQLQNQDPLNPMDHKEFSAQLAQFASLEKLTQIGTGIEKLEGGLGEESKLQALGMIGRRVQAGGAEVQLLENKPVDIHLSTEGGFRPLKVSIYDLTGKLVREIATDPSTDTKQVTWDGRNTEGGIQAAGKYRFRVAGLGKDNKATEMQGELTGKVVGVEMVDRTPMLILDTTNGQTKIELAQVRNIASDDEKKADAQKTETDKAKAEKKQSPTTNKPTIRWPGEAVADSGQRWMENKP